MPIPEWLLELNRGFFVEEAFHDNCIDLLRCTPFIGAGMSVALDFPTWAGFLSNIAEQLKLTDIVDLLNEKDRDGETECNYEEIASKIYEEAGGEIRFRQIGKNVFNKNVPEDKIIGSAVELLPRLFSNRHVITTNYDNVLSDVYARREGGRHMTVIEYTNNIAVGAALFTGDPAIIKLHGSFNIGSDYIFTKEQYNASYNSSSFQKELKSVLTNRQLFFIGCSLINERFLKRWRDVITENKFLHHYAIMEMAKNDEEQRELEDILEKHNISAIWYPHGEYDKVRTILEIIGKEAGLIDYEYPQIPVQHSFVDRKDANNSRSLLKTIYGDKESAFVSSVQGEFQSKFVYINGLGGIGKTTLLNQFYHEIKKKIGQSLSENTKLFHMEFCTDWTNTLKTRKINIKSSGQHYILFVDNLPEDWYLKEDEAFKEFAGRCQIFVTSRASIDEMELSYIVPYTKSIHYIDLGWNFPNSEELFMKYFNPPEPSIFEDNKYIKELVELSGNHTLAIEILANHARERCRDTTASISNEILAEFTKELKANEFDLSELYYMKNINNKEYIYRKITKHLKMLVNMDDLSEGEKELMQIFSLLAESPFHPDHIQFDFQKDCMGKLIQLGWIKKCGDDDYVMHEIVKKLIYDRKKKDSLEYLKLRNLVFCIGKALSKRSIEKAGHTVFEEIDTINHAQSLYDYLKCILPQEDNIDILDFKNPCNDSGFVEMVNNLFSSYDDIDIREKAFEGSKEAELLSRNIHDYALYTYAVSANGTGYLCAHSLSNRLPHKEHLKQAFSHLKSAERALDEMFDINNKEANVLRGKILSNFGAYYNGCLKLDIECKRQKLKRGEQIGKDLEDDILKHFHNAVKYHTASLELRENLFKQYGDENIRDYIFTSKENIANDYYQVGNLVKSVNLRLMFLPEFETYYGNKVHIKKFVTLRNLGDTCKNIVVALSRNEAVIGASKDELQKYREMAIKYLQEAKIMRQSLDNHKDIIKAIDESLETLKNNYIYCNTISSI